VVTCIQPRSPPREVFVLPPWLAAHSSGEANPSCLSQLDGFMKQWRPTPSAPEATQAKRWLKCQPRSYVRLEAYSFLGLSGGA
jgi:hypothetical protein